MKKLTINRINQDILYEKLNNGLDVYFCKTNHGSNVYATLTAKYGSIHKYFKPYNKKMTTMPDGIAHFLEHKIFAQPSGEDVGTIFEESGITYNAHTSLKSTTYEISGVDDISDKIIYLLDFVQTPYFTKENVEIERGIIKQEINMCNDNPWNILYDKIRYNVFQKDPIRLSIAGTPNDIDNINEQLLYDCYNTFYNPSNMFLVVTGSFDCEDLINKIKINQQNKTFPKEDKIELKKIEEKDEVYIKEEIVPFNTYTPKFAYTIKLPLMKNIPKGKLILYLHIIFDILFDETSEFNYNAKLDNLITHDMQLDILNTSSHVIISLINETSKVEELKERIINILNNIQINEEDFNRKKKVLISNELFGYENIVIINDIIVDNILFDNKIEENIIPIIESLNMEELHDVIKNINLKNTSTVIIKKERKK